MPRPSLPPDVEATLTRMQRDIDSAWAAIKREEAALIAAWPAHNRPVRVERLREMREGAEDMMGRVDAMLAREVPIALTTAYETGAWGAALQGGRAATFTAIDVNAATALASDTMTDLLAATGHVRSSTRDLVQTLAREHMRDTLYSGLTAREAGRRLSEDLASKLGPQGIHAVVYRDGSRVGLPAYSNMVARTKTAQAYQEGGFQQGRQMGITYWEIMDGSECGLTFHDDPELADGMIVPTAVAEAYPIAHPNCVRVTSPRPDIENADDADAATRTTHSGLEDQQQDAIDAQQQSAGLGHASLTGDVNRALLAGADVDMPGPVSEAAARHARRVEGETSPRSAVTDTMTPGQAARTLVDEANAREPALTATMVGLADKHGGELSGLDHRVKGAGSLERKITGTLADDGGTVSGVAGSMSDVNRYTMVLPDGRYATASQAVVDDLRSAGSDVYVKNYWTRENNPYQGINARVTPPGQSAYELQFHTPESLRVKEGELHRIYEIRRVTTDEALIARLDSESFAAASVIPIPRSVGDVD